MNASTTDAAPFSAEAARCREEQVRWKGMLAKDRLRHAAALRHLLVARCDELCAGAAKDIGKPAEESIALDLLPLAEALRFLECQAGRLLRPRKIARRHRPVWLIGERDWVYRRPRGIVGIIGTWNFPFFLNGVQIAQALTAGNGVLWKPSEVAPASALLLHGLFLEAGYPRDLVQRLPPTRDAGPRLAQTDIDHIVFTGSSAVGRKLAETLGRRLISSTLELSGCDPLFVLDDADVNLAARATWFSATLNRGQTCLATRRVFVHRSIYGDYADALRPLVANGKAMPLALSSQAKEARRLVDEALAHGAKLLEPIGSPAPHVVNGSSDKLASAPTVLIDARPEMALCREACFAPIVAVIPFQNLEEAVRQNELCCRYGLGAAIFTADPQRGLLLAQQLQVGQASINDVIVPIGHPATPFGGVRESGWGVTQGAEGLLEMTVPQVISVRSGRIRPHYDAALGKPFLGADGLKGMLAMGHAAAFGQRVRGLMAVFRSLRKPRLPTRPSGALPDGEEGRLSQDSNS
jgi:acyl-CoA reductase-like NAD-dependent aldehyde dehydrogenase